MEKTIVIMPVANEEESMADILDRILGLPYDNLFVYPVLDSYSKDGTQKIVEGYEHTSRVKCLFNRNSDGVVSCYLYGFQKALEDGAQRVIEMDGGGSHLPEEIPQFIDMLEKGYDCVFGSRFINGGSLENDPLYRRLLSSGGTFLANIVLGTRLKDMTSGFEAFRREVLEEMDFSRFLSKGHMYQTEMRYYCRNHKNAEVPIHYRAGKSSLKLKSITEALRILFLLKRNERKVVL